jgi:hypothetical protein
MTMECKIPPDVAPKFTLPPPVQRVHYKDPVDDPTESWKNWGMRVRDFQFWDAPKVERESLPDE